MRIGGGLYLGGIFCDPGSTGIGIVTVDNEATLEVDGLTRTYGFGFMNSLRILNGLFTIHDLFLEDAAGLLLADGEARVTAGTLDVSEMNPTPLMIDHSSTNGARFALDDGATGHLRCTTGPTLRVGLEGKGHLDVLNASQLFIHDHNAVAGDEPGSSGIIQLEGASSLTVDEILILGREGNGVLNVLSGSQARLNDLRSGTQAGGAGGVVIDHEAFPAGRQRSWSWLGSSRMGCCCRSSDLRQGRGFQAGRRSSRLRSTVMA